MSDRSYFKGFFNRFSACVVFLLAALLLWSALTASCHAEEARSRLGTLWTVTKYTGYGAAAADSLSTSYQIKRGYVESSGPKLENLFIDRSSPAYAQRMLLIQAEAFAINWTLDRAWNARDCRRSKLCKGVVIGARGFFTYLSVKNTVHNMRLK